ncbi:hypothetical protein [Halorussus caseinilyticus]|uniref:DNA replication factor GINS n=1 Tax=Halorussus caseinilyticus TaxID=3034025 RepID=A0ABD5WP49_9EURY|nr:hypothetical protein [Halorussus sp. DT72]
MNLDELRTVQSKERSKDSLQHLRESFYADVADYIADLKDQRERAAERADSPFDDPEVNRLTDEISTAEDVVEAVYERRVGKIVKRASLAAAGMPADEEGLTGEEQELFTELVERIESNKQDVLSVLAGESAGAAESPTPPPADSPSGESAPASGGSAASDPVADSGDPSDLGGAPAPGAGASGEDVSAADVMGGDAGEATDARSDATVGSTPSGGSDGDGERPAAAEAAAIADGPDPGATAGPANGESPADERSSAGAASAPDSGADDDDPLAGLDERTTVRLTDDVGEIFGVDERTYELASEDVVTLPEANAEPLVERGAAERLE